MMAVELRALRLEGACEKHISNVPDHAFHGSNNADSPPDACIGLDTWAPNINLMRDPRWGRNWEVASEDPYHTGQIGAAYATGFQVGEDPRYLLGVITLKHWAAYSVEKSRTSVDDNVTAFDLSDSYLVSFRNAVLNGHAAGMMCSYNAIQHVPTCASDPLNTLLREVWGFDGYITSDTGAIDAIYSKHKYVKTPEEAAAVAVNVGVDINSGSVFKGHLEEALRRKLTNDTMVDAALRRAFRTRMRLGLFDPPGSQPYEHFGPEVVGNASHHQLSLEASRQGLVLMQNNGATLPLRRGVKLAIIGPNAETRALLVAGTGGCISGACLSAQVVCKNATNSSDWCCVPSVVDELKRLNTGGSVTVTEGAKIHSKYDPASGAAAIAAAKAADAVIFVIGGDWQVDHEAMDRSNIDLPGGQNDLIQAVTDSIGSHIPTVAVLIHGGIMDIENVTQNVDAIVDANYPGMHGGTAIAEVLFGDVNPSGKLPVTWYHGNYTEQVDILDFSMAKPPGRSYRYYNGSVIFPAFHGLSYTTFSMSLHDHQPVSMTTSTGSIVNFTLKVENTGRVRGTETVFAFWRQPGWKHPLGPGFQTLQRRLFGYERVELAAGASATISISLTVDGLSQVRATGDRWATPGKFEIIFGRGFSDSEVVTPFQLTGSAREIEAFPQGLAPQL